MNKAELITALAEEMGTSKVVASTALSGLMDVITDTLADGEEISITGFGKFSVVDRAARTAVNPQTGEPVQVEACKVPKFKPGKNFKELIND